MCNSGERVTLVYCMKNTTNEREILEWKSGGNEWLNRGNEYQRR